MGPWFKESAERLEELGIQPVTYGCLELYHYATIALKRRENGNNG